MADTRQDDEKRLGKEFGFFVRGYDAGGGVYSDYKSKFSYSYLVGSETVTLWNAILKRDELIRSLRQQLSQQVCK